MKNSHGHPQKTTIQQEARDTEQDTSDLFADFQPQAAKRGRPKSRGRVVNLTLAVSPEAAETLGMLAAKSGCNKWEIAETLFLEAAKGPAPMPKEALALARDAADFIALHGNSEKAKQALERAGRTAMAMARRCKGSE